MKAIIGRALVLACLGLCLPAQALNIDKDMPVANFTKEDLALFKAALESTLEKGIDGIGRSWSNEDTKAGGELTPTRSFKQEGASCRTLTIKNNAKGRTASAPYTFCKPASGAWALRQ